MMSAAADAPRDPSAVVLAIGVLNHAANSGRREAIRSSWWRCCTAPPAGAGRVIRRFVLRDVDAQQPAVAAEATEHGDLELLHGVGEGRLYATKIFGWLVRAAERWRPEWILHADDDSFVRADVVLRDVLTLGVRGDTSRVFYGAIEWSSFDRGALPSATSPGASYSRMGWGGNAATAGRAWRKLVLERKNPRTGRSIDPKTSPGYSRYSGIDPQTNWSRVSRPFPFVKGPLKVFSGALATLLTTGAHQLAEQSHAYAVPSTVRLLEDIFIGYLLASERGGLGSIATTWVDIGVAHNTRNGLLRDDPPVGLWELRRSLNITSPAMGCSRGVHMGHTILRDAARWSDWNGNCTGGIEACVVRTLAQSMAKLARVADASRLNTTASYFCQPAQPHWGSQSKGTVVTGADWQDCRIRWPRGSSCRLDQRVARAQRANAIRLGIVS